MKLKVGQKVKLEARGNGTANLVADRQSARIGVIDRIEEHYIIIKFHNYKESITKADIIATAKEYSTWILYVRVNKRWDKVTKEMIS